MSTTDETRGFQQLRALFESGALLKTQRQDKAYTEGEKRVIADGLKQRGTEVREEQSELPKAAPASPPPPRRRRPKARRLNVPNLSATPESSVDSEISITDRPQPRDHGHSHRMIRHAPGAHEVKVAEERVERLKEENEQAQKRTRDLDAKRREMDRLINDYREKYHELEESRMDLIAAGEAGKQRRAELKEEIDELRQEIRKYRRREDELRRDWDESRRREDMIRRRLLEAEEEAFQARHASARQMIELEKQYAQQMRKNIEESLRPHHQHHHHHHPAPPRLPQREHSRSRSPVQLIQGRDPRDVDLLHQQQAANHELLRESDRLRQENRELRERSQSADGSRKSDRSSDNKSKKGHKRSVSGLVRSRKNRTSVSVLSIGVA
ncbi:hypothetical protein F5B20DRAFT_95151 [Whalleya microplaca]|nr:hypothetical protein F5B20DRAFT_95151 [Whalleya microplaca]